MDIKNQTSAESVLSNNASFQILENLPRPLVVYDNDSRIVYVNHETSVLLGYSQQEMIGMNVEEIVNRNHRSSTDKYVAQARQSRELFFATEVLSKSGESISIDPKTITLPDIHEGLIVTIFHVVDVDTNRKQLINAIIDTEINERKRFAKDLHDGLGPLLSTVKLYVNELKDKKTKAKERDELLAMVTQLVDDAINNARETANNLMPTVIKNYGLVSAVSTFVAKINLLKKHEINFLAIPSDLRLDNTLETSFYRIIKELVNNTIKHANAKKIDIILSLEKNILSLNFTDDGIGFDLGQVGRMPASGLGLSNIINRVNLLNGQINIDTSKGKGLKVGISIDLANMFSTK